MTKTLTLIGHDVYEKKVVRVPYSHLKTTGRSAA